MINISTLNIFISYSSSDKEKADEICTYLENNGKKCWMAPRDITAGAEYGEEIIKGIETSDVMVVVFSKASNASQHVLREIERAVNRKMPIISFKIEDCTLSKSMEYFLLSNQWLDATSDMGGMLGTLNLSIEKIYRIANSSDGEGAVTPGSTIRVSNKTVPIILSAAALVIVVAAVAVVCTFYIQPVRFSSAVPTTTVASETPSTTDFPEPEPVIMREGCYKAGETITTDLDGDGNIETLLYTVSDDEFATSKIEINGVEYGCSNFPVDCFWICDIDTTDNFLEIAVSSFGPSDDYETEFYRFDNGAVRDIGHIEEMVDSAYQSAYSTMVGKSTTLNGDGTISAMKKLYIFQTWYAYTTYTYNPETMTLEEHSDIYYPYGEENMNSFEGATGIQYADYNIDEASIPETVARISLYSEMDTSSEVVVFEPQHFMATATDNINWVYLVGENGTGGWLLIQNETQAVDAYNGQLYDYNDAMINLYLYG